jgi:hypothetical protein
VLACLPIVAGAQKPGTAVPAPAEGPGQQALQEKDRQMQQQRTQDRSPSDQQRTNQMMREQVILFGLPQQQQY